MSTVEAMTTADAAEAGGRTKSSSPRTIPVIGVVIPHEDMQVPSGWAAGAGKGVRFRGNRVESRIRASLWDGEERSSSRGAGRLARGAGCRQPICLGTLAAWSSWKNYLPFGLWPRKEGILLGDILLDNQITFLCWGFDCRSVLRGRTLGINILLLKLVFTGRQMLLESWGQNCFSLV